MCEFKEKITDKKEIIGYKIAIEDKYGHYYSPFTGIRYTKGLIRIPKKSGVHSVWKKNGIRQCIVSR